MYAFETVLSARQEAEQVTTAFYRFLSTHAVPGDADAAVHTDIVDGQWRCTVALWSAEICDEFRRYLNRFELPHPLPLTPRFGPSSAETPKAATGDKERGFGRRQSASF